VNKQVPRLVDSLPNGPENFPTVIVFMAGGVPEVMLHLRKAGLLDTSVKTASACSLDAVLDWWEGSERRHALRKQLAEREGIAPERVIHSMDKAMSSTVCFPVGNLAPEGSVIKATAIDPSVVDADGVYRKRGPAKVFVTEASAIAAIKEGRIEAGDVMVLCSRGPLGSGMEETYQVTSALKHLPFGKHVALVTDARFSGVSTGACIGHVSPEALAGGPIGKVLDGDEIEIVVDRNTMEGTFNLVDGERLLAEREPRPDLRPDAELPDDTRLWAALVDASGGSWGGAVYDVDAILRVMAAGKKALGEG
jgi:dihydroxyacid dehydratase/phosphogluconate dehydratase